MIEKGPENNQDKISEEVEREFQGAVEEARENNPFSVNRPLKYKVGTRVWVPDFTVLSAEVKKGSDGVYILKFENGKYLICPEEDIEMIN